MQAALEGLSARTKAFRAKILTGRFFTAQEHVITGFKSNTPSSRTREMRIETTRNLIKELERRKLIAGVNTTLRTELEDLMANMPNEHNFSWNNSHNCNNNLEHLSRFAQEYLNEKLQQERADTWQIIKFLTFRILTALSIAGVILLTGYLAQKYNIPLPLLRLS